jgi:mono/diheme cytochrome c family protein
MMKMKRALAVLVLGWAAAGCGSEKASEPTGQSTVPVTYYDDVAPIFQDHCMFCHQDGGIGPFKLNDYGTAKQNAAAIAANTASGAMPPWSVTSDGTCGDFAGSLALTPEQIDTISKWQKGGALEGTPHELTVPSIPTLGGGTPYETPVFSPVAQGGPLTEADEYRCFLLDSGVAAQRFITGYEVTPGSDAIIHHVLAFVIDPSAKAELPAEPNLTNGQLMDRLHAQTPDRDGWPCFGMAGDGVAVKSVPVVWAPGQGPVEFPVKSGVPLAPTDKVVLQVHYNLRDPASVGQSVQTTVHLALAEQVERVGIFILKDPFLSTLGDAQPALLQAGKASVKYTWSKSLQDFGIAQLPDLQLNGVMPHMHQLGRKYQLAITSGANEECAANVKNWDFHWQRMYFYDEPPALAANSAFNVTCDYDTSGVTEPVQPGWGTSNEMCLATLYFTVPASAPQ